jgi:cofilin
MQESGVTVSREVESEFNQFMLGVNRKSTFIIFKIENNERIVIDFISGEDEVFQTFLDKLPKSECRFAVYSFDFTTKDGQARNKIVSISWLPDTARVTEKMLYSTSKDALPNVMGVTTRIRAYELDELTEEIVLEACRKFT